MGLTLPHEPGEFDLGAGHSIVQRLVGLLGHYDLRVYVQDHCWIEVGRGSLEAALHVEMVPEGHVGCVGTVGQMCDFAWNCALHAGGEHWNALPVNVVFSGITALARVTSEEPMLRPRHKASFRIGHAVVVSSAARVLPGADLGDGVVLGANSVVSGALPAFHVCGGVPARAIRARFDEAVLADIEAVRWWDFDLDYIAQNAARLQALVVDRTATHVYRREQPRFVIKVRRRAAAFDVEVRGFAGADGVERPLADAPARVRDYVAQLAGPGPYQWIADAWA